MCPLRGRYSAAAVVIAASRIADDRILWSSGRVTTVSSLTQTTGVQWRSCSLQRDWNECCGQRKQQQKSCG